MYSISMTTRLGLMALLGAIAIVVIADGKDQAPFTCKGETCATSQVMSKKIPKRAQQSNRSTDLKAIGLAPGDSGEAGRSRHGKYESPDQEERGQTIRQETRAAGDQEFMAQRRETAETASQ